MPRRTRADRAADDSDPTGVESGKRDSNPRPQPWQGCALPTELFPQYRIGATTTDQHFVTTFVPTPSIATTALSRSYTKRGVQRFDSPRHGGEGNRTPDLLNAIQALSQLSYAPGLGWTRGRRDRWTATALPRVEFCTHNLPAVHPFTCVPVNLFSRNHQV
jgi:hypothetical protein